MLVVSGPSLIGALSLVLRRETLQRGLLVLISFAAGELLGDAFLHLIPEIAESEGGWDVTSSFALLGGVIAFFILEKGIHWHHAHVPSEEVLHPVAVANLVGDALHNFVDGAILAGAFIASPKLEFATAIAVALHESGAGTKNRHLFTRSLFLRGAFPERSLRWFRSRLHHDAIRLSFARDRMHSSDETLLTTGGVQVFEVQPLVSLEPTSNT